MNKCDTFKHDFSYAGKKKLTEITCKNCDVKLVDWVDACRDQLEEESGMDIVSLIVQATRNGKDDICECEVSGINIDISFPVC